MVLKGGSSLLTAGRFQVDSVGWTTSHSIFEDLILYHKEILNNDWLTFSSRNLNPYPHIVKCATEQAVFFLCSTIN